VAYSISEAKELVIRAGKILVESGLIQRTWGNISARISDTQFVITPSGLAYETLTPKQIVTVNIADGSYEGDLKPSSEKGIHADSYRLRPEVNFVIHTHQERASEISIDGKNWTLSLEEDKKVLGDLVPCAAYGMPSTGKLKKAVEEAISRYPNSRAFLMKHHGVLCLGKDLDHAFEIAQYLENVADRMYQQACKGKLYKKDGKIREYGSSERSGGHFTLLLQGTAKEYKIDALETDAPVQARLHAKIYQSSKMNYILHATDEDIVAVSQSGRSMSPLLDDLAQIAGVTLKTVQNAMDNTSAVKQLKHKNAVLLAGEGALCTGITDSDAKAVEMVLKKGCAARIYAKATGSREKLGLLDASIQRMVYVKKYSKKKM